MTRSMFMALRMFALLIATLCLSSYIILASRFDNNEVDYSICAAAFLSTYLFMAALLCIFTRIRKNDLGILTVALVGMTLLAQLGLARLHLAPAPQLSEAFAASLGIFASLLPMWISHLRGESRHERHIAAFVESRQAIVSPPFISQACFQDAKRS